MVNHTLTMQKEPLFSITLDSDIYFTEITPDNNYLITLSGDKQRCYWSMSKKLQKKPLKSFFTPDIYLLNAEFSLDGSKVIYHSQTYRSAIIHRVKTNEVLHILDHFGRLGSVMSASFSLDAKRVVTSSHDGTVVVWNIENKLFKEHIIKQQKDEENFFDAVLNDGQNLLFIASYNKLFVYDLTKKEKKFSIFLDTQVFSASISQNWKYIATPYKNTIRIYSALDAQLISTITKENLIPKDVYFSSDSKIMTVIYDDAIILYETKNFKAITKKLPHYKGIKFSMPILSDDKNYIITLLDKHTLGIFLTENSHLVQKYTHKNQIDKFALSKESKYLYSLSNEKRFIQVWDFEKSLL